MAHGKMLTSSDGPVVVSEKTLLALSAIRREKLLPELFGRVAIARSCVPAGFGDRPPAWLDVHDDRPGQPLPERVTLANPSPADAATLRLALALPASLVLIEGLVKERAKLSFIKCEGTLSILVEAYRNGKLSAVRPMVNALESLGHGDVLPPREMLEALWKALDQLT